MVQEHKRPVLVITCYNFLAKSCLSSLHYWIIYYSFHIFSTLFSFYQAMCEVVETKFWDFFKILFKEYMEYTDLINGCFINI